VHQLRLLIRHRVERELRAGPGSTGASYRHRLTIRHRYLKFLAERAGLLLVLMLVVGVFSMHALGHMAGGGMGMVPAAPAAGQSVAGPAQHASTPDAGYRIADRQPANMCLGLAGGFGLLVACVLLRRVPMICCRGRAVAAPGIDGAPLGSRAGRSPPGRGGFAVPRVAWV
jgi:hypothetical protein